MRLKNRAIKGLIAGAVTLAMVGTGVLVGASPAAAATRCVSPFIGWNAASGGCDNDGTLDTRLVLTCQVIGSEYEYNVVSVWYSRYTSWQGTIFCYGGSARAMEAWYEGRH